MVTARPDLVKVLGAAVATAYTASAASEFPRAMENNGPLEITVCLGSGRCLFPTKGSGHRVCAFCKTLPHGFLARESSDETVRRFVMGN